MKTIERIHRERLAILRDESGGVGKLAERIEKSFSQVSQWINASTNSGTGRARGMSDDVCRHIEIKCEKPEGWMDADPDRVDATVLARLIALYIGATESGQLQIIAAAESAQKISKAPDGPR